MALYSKRTREDYVTERKMMLYRGFRFEEPLSLTIFEYGTDIVMGHVCGVLYFSNVLSQTPDELLCDAQSLMTDDLTRMIFAREYRAETGGWHIKRNLFVLHDPVCVVDEIDVEEVLDQVRKFVDWYYSVSLNAVYQQKNGMRGTRFCNGLVLRYICRDEVETGLLQYEYENEE